jgi:hypothetical protein
VNASGEQSNTSDNPSKARAARTITGAFRATSKPALDIEAYLAPMRLQLEKAVLRAYMRLAASPLHSALQNVRHMHQAIQPRIWSQLERHRDRGRSRLEREALNKLESKLPCTAAPRWAALIISIAETADLEARACDATPLEPGRTIHICTDGSGINSKIGAAAVTLREGITRKAFMGRLM